MNNSNNNETEVGKVMSTLGGAGTGVAGSVGLVSLAGSGTGTAVVTSGLAAIGSVVGGGMLAGLGIVAAIPIAAGAVGYGGYRLIKNKIGK